jgi:hypothetical protein
MQREISIPRVSLNEFEAMIASSPDLLSQSPFVVTDFVERQPARKLWCDLDYLERELGHLRVTAGAPQFTTNIGQNICRVETSYGDYLKYVRNPNLAEELFGSSWLNGSYEEFVGKSMPLYCGNVRFVLTGREPILNDLAPFAPKNFSVWNALIPFYYRLKNHVWLYVSLKGSLTPLHQDNNAVISCLAQYKGRKFARLFHPSDKSHYHSKTKGYMDVLNPDPDDYESWTSAPMWTAELQDGEVLFWGADWAHHVVTLEDSISSSIDFVNQTNIAGYFASSEWKEALGSMARQNTASKYVSSLEASGLLSTSDNVQLGARIMNQALHDCVRKCSEDTRHIYDRMLELSNSEFEIPACEAS